MVSIDELLPTAKEIRKRAKHRHDRRVTGKDAEIALDARQVNLINIARKQEFLGRHKAQLEGWHTLRFRMP